MISVLIFIKKVIFVVYRYLHKLVLNPGWGEIFITKRFHRQLPPKSRRYGIATVRQQVSVQFVYNTPLNCCLDRLILEHI